MAVEQQKRRGIQSVGIGMRVLAATAAMQGPATLSAIAQRAGLSASQTHRYLRSLMEAGMLRQAGKSGLYDLDAGTIRIGLAALSRIDAFSNADVYMERVVQDTRRTCLISVFGSAGPTIVRWYSGVPPVLTSLSVGSTLPLMRSATGRVFFAFGDPAEMDRQAGIMSMHDPAGVPTNLAATRLEIRKRGYDTLGGALIPGLRTIAAPIFDLQGKLVLVASMVSNSMFPASEDATADRALLARCRELTESLGGALPIEIEAKQAPAKPKAAKPVKRKSPLSVGKG